MQEVKGPPTYSDLKSGQYSMTLRLDQIPRCPICGRTLCGQITRIRSSVAMCDRCFKVHPMIHAHHVSALLLPELIASQTSVSGVIFWCPKNPMWTNLQLTLSILGYQTNLLTDPPPTPALPNHDCSMYLDLHKHTLDFLPLADLPPGRMTPPVTPMSSPDEPCTR